MTSLLISDGENKLSIEKNKCIKLANKNRMFISVK